MPWMLLRGAGFGHADVSTPTNGTTGSPLRSGPRDAWVLIGGLDRALVQAGMAAELLDANERPGQLFTAGISAVNALLLAAGDAKTFSRGWEALRERRFLSSSALSSNRFLGIANSRSDALVNTLADVLTTEPDSRGASAPCYAAVENGFVLLPGDPGDGAWRAIVRQTLRFAASPPPLLAAAIREARALADRVIVVGVERTSLTHPDVEAAIRPSAKTGTKVSCLVAPAPRPPGVLQYLLPGSGAPERLYEDGRGSALRWLTSGALPSRNGGRHGAPADARSGEGDDAEVSDL